jgi:hypothetical protein
MPIPAAEVILATLAAVFFVLAARDYRRHPGRPTPARKAWLRVAVLFTAVAVGLTVLRAISR